MSSKQTEIPVVIPCEGDSLIGIIHKPVEATSIGVVIIVAGGPQYRVGAHRQFVTLARLLADNGIASIRFDHRGTGDSTGELRGFIDMNADIHGAINTLSEHIPEINQFTLWGECESATAGAFYCYTDKRIQGIFMVNPWIRTDYGQAKTILKHYYWARLFDKAFWKKVRSGQFSLLNSLKSYIHLLKSARSESKVNLGTDLEESLEKLPLPERLAKSCERYQGNILVLTSGYDYIAQEFKDYVESSEIWGRLIDHSKVTMHDIPDSDHTFSRPEWRKELFDHTITWVKNLTKSSDR